MSSLLMPCVRLLVRGGFLLVVLLTGSAAFAQDPQPASIYQKDIRPILAERCFKCHDAEKKKGGIVLTVFADEKAIARQRKLWLKVVEAIDGLEMPPNGEAPLPAEQREHLVRWIRLTVNTVDCTNPADRNPGKTVVRRLTRSEYNRTLRDLLGLDFDAAEAVGMADDAAGAGFANMAEALNLSPTLLDKYFAAADKALDRVFAGKDTVAPPKSDVNAWKRARQMYLSVFVAKPGDGLSERDAARKIIARFTPRAYRRPATDAEIDRLLRLYDLSAKKGDPFENRVRLMLKAALVSPNFLLRVEQDRGKEGSTEAYRVSDHELAVRLSYFLWSSMPDDALVALAEQNKLSEPAELERQVKRMLADPKARALTDDFAVQWLQLRKLADARPSTEFFPTFNQRLRQAMHEETTTFFDKLREEDQSLLRLLDADYTYVNADLAKHYSLSGVEGPQLRRVVLKPEDHRGGLMGMSSMLALTSHTSRTSPTLRGKWVLEVILGTPPPPPPPDAGTLDESKAKGPMPKTFRELMTLHATRPVCAGCHAKIDPLGYGLENYDAVGRWRDAKDVTGQLPGGDRFTGPAELKRLLLKRQDQFLRNVTERMLTYALGRELQYDDECAIKDVMTALNKNEQRFSALVLGVVRSYAFQHRRNADN